MTKCMDAWSGGAKLLGHRALTLNLALTLTLALTPTLALTLTLTTRCSGRALTPTLTLTLTLTLNLTPNPKHGRKCRQGQLGQLAVHR